jgi:hypothetical protein
MIIFWSSSAAFLVFCQKEIRKRIASSKSIYQVKSESESISSPIQTCKQFRARFDSDSAVDSVNRQTRIASNCKFIVCILPKYLLIYILIIILTQNFNLNLYDFFWTIAFRVWSGCMHTIHLWHA